MAKPEKHDVRGEWFAAIRLAVAWFDDSKKITRPLLSVNRVCRPSHVTNSQALSRIASSQQRLEIAVPLALGGVGRADDHNVGVAVDLESVAEPRKRLGRLGQGPDQCRSGW